MSDLKYVGDGRAIVGIPADTIDAETLDALAAKHGKKPAELRKELVDSGLYAEKPEKESKP